MRKLLCLVYNKMADFEVTLTGFILTDPRHQMVTIGYRKEPVTALSGMIYLPSLTVDESLELDDVDGLVIPGGNDAEHCEVLYRLIRRLNEQGKLLAAICAGPKYLAQAGVLTGRKFTTSVTEQYFRQTGEADPFPPVGRVSENVVRDGNIVTGQGTAFVDFAVEVCDALGLFRDGDEKAMVSRMFKGLPAESK